MWDFFDVLLWFLPDRFIYGDSGHHSHRSSDMRWLLYVIIIAAAFSFGSTGLLLLGVLVFIMDLVFTLFVPSFEDSTWYRVLTSVFFFLGLLGIIFLAIFVVGSTVAEVKELPHP